MLHSRVVNLDYQVKDLTKELEQAQKHASLTNNILEQFLYHGHDNNRYCTQEHKVQERLEEINGLHKELWSEHDEGRKFLADYFLRGTDFCK